jgi:hypothetical protein
MWHRVEVVLTDVSVERIAIIVKEGEGGQVHIGNQWSGKEEKTFTEASFCI